MRISQRPFLQSLFVARAVGGCALCLVSSLLQGAPTEARAPALPHISAELGAATNRWGRIVILGASASAGFTASEPLGGPNTAQFRLNRYVDAAIAAPHRPARNVASSFFFMQPEEEGRRQVELALEDKPTLVLGADFLFWFCYGDGHTDLERQQRFETGLKLCESFRCPLVLGDIPDASAAVNGMLSPEQVPSPSAIAAATQRLKSWAATRPNVAVLSLSNFMAAVVANQTVTVHGYRLARDSTSALLQPDHLHPSGPGCAVLALLMLDALQSKHTPPIAPDIRWDPKEVFRLVSTPAAGGVKQIMPAKSAPKELN